jgi:hypothetical protein
MKGGSRTITIPRMQRAACPVDSKGQHTSIVPLGYNFLDVIVPEDRVTLALIFLEIGHGLIIC